MTEPRRSVRSTKGVNTRRASPAAAMATPTPAEKKKPRKSASASSPAEESDVEEDKENDEDGADDIIRCVCGAKEEDEDDERMMIQCEKCDAWQHTHCMGIPKKKIPNVYYCELCQPEAHEKLLQAMAAGETPWEKKTRRGRKRKSIAKKDEEDDEKVVPEPKTPKAKEEPEKATPATGRKQAKKPAAREGTVESTRSRRTSTLVPDTKAIETPIPPPAPKVETPIPPPVLPAKPATPATPVLPVGTSVEGPKAPAPTPIPPPAHIRTAPIEQDPQPMEGVEPTGPMGNGTSGGMSPPPPLSAISPTTPAFPPSAIQGRRPSTAHSDSPAIKNSKRKSHDADSEFRAEASGAKEPASKKQRRQSVVPGSERRRSSTSTVKQQPKEPKRQEDWSPQMEEVTSRELIRSDTRRKAVTLLMMHTSQHVARLIKQGVLKLEIPEGKSEDEAIASLRESFALRIEHAIYRIMFRPGSDFSNDYVKKCRAVGANLKSNPVLCDQFLTGTLSAETLAGMSTEEMANKELQEFTKKAREFSEKQHTLIKEEGRRIKRTHKGEELVEDVDNMSVSGDTFLGPGGVGADPEAEAEKEKIATPVSQKAHSPSVPVESPATGGPSASETPRSPSAQASAQPEASEPTAEPTKERSFSLANVWDNVAPGDDTNIPRHRPAAPVSGASGVMLDKDIDKLLRDDVSPPYSPKSNNDDHYSPKSESDPDKWYGSITMNNNVKLSCIGTLLGGPSSIGSSRWQDILDPSLLISGRIKPDRATEYLCGQRYSKSSALIMAALEPSSSFYHEAFEKVFAYFLDKERYAVVGAHSKQCIKDLYIVPLEKNAPLPDWFGIPDPPPQGWSDEHPKMMVMIFVVVKSYVEGYVPAEGETPFGTPSFNDPRVPQPSVSGSVSGSPSKPQGPWQAPATTGPTPWQPPAPTQQQQPWQPPVSNGTWQPPREHHPLTLQLKVVLPTLAEDQADSIDRLLFTRPELAENGFSEQLIAEIGKLDGIDLIAEQAKVAATATTAPQQQQEQTQQGAV